MAASDLTQRLREGDDTAAAELYARYRPVVFDLLARKLGNLEEAEGVAQEALVRALDAARTQEVRSFAAFVLRIANNLAIDRIRRARFERERTDPEVALQIHFDPDQAELGRLEDAVAQLPPDLQQVVQLKYGEGLSFSEIGERLSLSKNGVFSRHNRALDLLRDAFARRRT
jgi:RNA polymerase sigma-70 factor (ECF subfamily)